jgi:hypothetical protein
MKPTLQVFTTDSLPCVRIKIQASLMLVFSDRVLRRGLRTFEINGFKPGISYHQSCFLSCMYDDDPTLLARELSTGEVLIGDEDRYAARVLGLDVGSVRCLSSAHFNEPHILHEEVTAHLNRRRIEVMNGDPIMEMLDAIDQKETFDRWENADSTV